MQNITVHLGSATPLSSRAGPCAPTLSTAPADRPAPPVSGTATRHCAAAHLSAPSLPALSGRHARGSRRPRAPRSSRCRGTPTGRGQAPRHPRAAWHPHARDPHLFPPLFPLPRCRRATRSSLALLHSFPRPHSSLTPSLERPSFPTTPRTQTATSGHRQPPLPRGFRPSTAAVRHSPVSSSPSYQSPKFLTNPSLPRLSQAAGLHHPHRRPLEPPPHRRTPPPDTVGTASPSTRRSGVPLSSPPCPTPSP
jgi:hypothetical protein